MPLKGARRRFAKFRETFAKLSLWVPRGALQSGVEQLPRGGLGGGKGRFEKVPEPPDFRAPEILDPRTPVRRFLRTGVRGSRIFGRRKFYTPGHAQQPGKLTRRGNLQIGETSTPGPGKLTGRGNLHAGAGKLTRRGRGNLHAGGREARSGIYTQAARRGRGFTQAAGRGRGFTHVSRKCWSQRGLSPHGVCTKCSDHA